MTTTVPKRPDLEERFTGAVRAAKLIDHRTPEAMALLKEHHLAQNNR